jgi:FkbM family methyltransferase
MHDASKFDIATLGGMGKIPEFRLAISKEPSDYEKWLLHSRCDSTIHRALVDLAGPQTFFVDVGANIGSITCPILALGSSVAGLEPLARNFLQLVASVNANDFDGVFLFNIAASNTNSLVGMEARGPNSYVATDGNNIIALKLDTLFRMCLGLQCKGKRLIIKVDTEGHEPEVFEGAAHVCAARRPIVFFESIVIEGHQHRTTRMLGVKRKFAAMGYRLFQILGSAFYETTAEDPQFEHVSDYVAVPADQVETLGTDYILSVQLPMDVIVETVKRLACFPIKYHRMHAAGLMKRLSLDLKAYLDVPLLVDKLRNDVDPDVVASARRHFESD